MKTSVANWGNYPVASSEVLSFSFTDELKQKLTGAQSFIARGNGRCYGDASLAPYIVSTLKYDKILSFDKAAGVFECQAGLTLDKILEVIVPQGWFLPVTPGTKFITLGGAVASDVHGKNHHVDGCFSAHVQEMDVLIADGETITCSPQMHADLFWATCGGMGLTGIIMRIKFGLKKIETAYIKQKQIKARNLDEVLQLFEKYQYYTYSVAWIDCLAKGRHFGRSILILGEHAHTKDLSGAQQTKALEAPQKKGINFPFYLPEYFLNKLSVKAFNALYYAKNLKKEIDNVVSYEPFFYPLDAVLHWNRGYGRKGFVQYQFVVPMEGKEGLIAILKKIADKGLGSFLAVLKVFGDQDDLISFPKKGLTLALDFPVRDGLFAFLDELDAMVLQYGGRIYLSKDARMQPQMFWKGYPNANRFFETVRKYNSNYKINSLQAQRLHITT